jgi:Zn finger protein HypA/HybF involved in hydrogenase expression
MHEVGIARELVKLALGAAGKADLGRLSRIEAKGHGLLPEEVESVRLHWEVETKGTLAEGSDLELEALPARGQCVDCGWQGVWEGGACPGCGGEDVLEEPAPVLELVAVSGE